MSDRDAHLDLGDDELGRLMTDLLDGSISAADHDRLAELLRADADARARYLDAIDLQALLRWEQAAPALRLVGADAEDKPAGRVKPMWMALGVAAAACLLAALTVALFLPSINRSGAPDPTTPDAVALVLDADGGGTLFSGETVLVPGSDVAAGAVSLDRGSAEFRLTNGVHIRLRGRTELTVRDPMHATLARGIATFTCPPDATGYAVDLPGGARVVDLGTVFEVRAGERGRSFVTVHSGAVEVIGNDGGPGQRITPGVVALVVDGRWHAAAAPGELDPGLYTEFIATDGPIAQWPLTLVPGQDEQTRERDGIAAADASVAGPVRHAATFTGTGAPMRTLPPQSASADGFTFEAWAYVAPDAAGWQRIVNVSGGADGQPWLLGMGPAEPRRGGATDASLAWVVTLPGVRDYRFDAPAPVRGRWQHVALVADAGGPVRLYIDGVQAEPADDATMPALTLGPRFTLGAARPGHETWSGALAHLAVYDRALPADVLREHVRLITPNFLDTPDTPGSPRNP